MARYNIRFLPDKKTVQAEAGTTIMDAANEAGVNINNLCGGKGVCGRCRVQIINGKIRADKHSISLLSKEEITEGYVLACQTVVDSDMEVVVPPESSLDEAQILLEGAPIHYSEPEEISVAHTGNDSLGLYDPLVQKVYLTLNQPTVEDNVSDVDRITRELRRKTEQQSFEISVRSLQGLAPKLRDNDWKVTTTLAKHGDMRRILQIDAGDTTDRNYGLAIDVGTTTLVAQLVHLKSGNIIGVAGSHNKQARYGEDVISRMVYACSRDDGLHPLHRAVIKNLNQLIHTLAGEKGIDVEDITVIVAAGNTTMSHLLLSLVPCSIRLDPYVPTATVYPQVPAKDLGLDIHPEGIVEVVPSVASYVGGDIVAGIVACGMADRAEVRALIDVGTNGEIAIGNNEWIVCCSASAGPAFEGGGIKNGMRATRGAIEKILLTDGKVQYKTIGEGKARGICGSGLIDCLHEFARNHIVSSEGRLHSSSGDGRIEEEEGEIRFILTNGEDTETGHPLCVTQSDINHLIRSKAAVFAAIKSLIDYVGLQFEDIAQFCVAGGFGNYLDIPKAIGIGLLPDISPDRIRFIGNSSLLGARMCLMSTHVLERAVKIAKNTTNVELSHYQPFMDEYVAAMFLPHTDRKLFPSIKY
jgi:uncharacterized 2Fe-2S/4Fe-4S cluster protein (DUF4445 family)